MQQELSYDAWGRLRDPQTLQVYARGSEPELFLGRGYTGHEHLSPCGGVGGGFGLINMNARLYDPLLGRFLSPDPYIQDPYNPHNYNRYAYCYNNPLKYTDPSGEIIFIDSFIAGFIKGLVNGTNVWKEGWNSVKNDAKIWGGLFTADTSQKGWGWQIVSRLFWQTPQTIAGFVYSHISNLAGQIDNVEYERGATVLSGHFWGNGGAITLSSYINGGPTLKADPNNYLYQHEYGHYLQSQEMGWGYLSRVGIPSLMSTFIDDNYHDFQPSEQDANRRAFNYFNKNVNGFYKSPEDYAKYGNNGVGWDFNKNPLDVYHTARRNNYYDYYNADHIALLNKNLSLRAEASDYLGCAFLPFQPLATLIWTVGIGVMNGIYYNSQRVIP